MDKDKKTDLFVAKHISTKRRRNFRYSLFISIPIINSFCRVARDKETVVLFLETQQQVNLIIFIAFRIAFICVKRRREMHIWNFLEIYPPSMISTVDAWPCYVKNCNTDFSRIKDNFKSNHDKWFVIFVLHTCRISRVILILSYGVVLIYVYIHFIFTIAGFIS